MSLSYRYGDDPYYVSSDYEKGANDAREEDGALLSECYELLSECADHFDRFSDADNDETGTVPNAEMQLLQKVLSVITKLEKRV